MLNFMLINLLKLEKDRVEFLPKLLVKELVAPEEGYFEFMTSVSKSNFL